MPRAATDPGLAHLVAIEDALTRLVRRARLPRSNQRLVERAGVALDPALYAVLARVGELAPVRLTDLAAALGVDASTASRQVKALEGDGLVDRTSDPADGRAAMFALSAGGRSTFDRLQEARRAALAEILTAWSADDRERLATLLQRFVDDITDFTDRTTDPSSEHT